jgi:histidinol-phosphate phosphatase family protein
MTQKHTVDTYLHQTAKALLEVDASGVVGLVDALWDAWQHDAAVLICGNGGSASTASALACDLSKEADIPGSQPLRALALTDSVEVITAWSNDAGFVHGYAEQVRIHGRPGDLLLCISCSGNSPNILAAVDQAREQGMKVAAMVGFGGGRLLKLSDIAVHVPAEDYGYVESAFTALHHCLSFLLGERAIEAHPKETANGDGGVVVFLDRDGVINHNVVDGVTSWDEFSFIPGSLEALADLKKYGCRVVVVTNQANIGRGRLTPANLTDLHRRMLREIIKAGGDVEAIYYCPHMPEEKCECRKPAPGMLLNAARDLDISLDNAFMIGDDYDDIGAAHAAGVRSVLVLSGRTSAIQPKSHPQPIKIAADLRAAVSLLSAQNAFDREQNRSTVVRLVR